MLFSSENIVSGSVLHNVIYTIGLVSSALIIPSLMLAIAYTRIQKRIYSIELRK